MAPDPLPPAGSRPLGLRSFHFQRYLRDPGDSWPTVPFLNLLLLGLFFHLGAAGFIHAPGLGVDLPSRPGGPLAGVPVAAVLTAKALGAEGETLLLLFEGRMVELAGLSALLQDRLVGRAGPDPVLLVKADRNVTAQHLLGICEAARQAGFARVQLAAQNLSDTPAAGSSPGPSP